MIWIDQIRTARYTFIKCIGGTRIRQKESCPTKRLGLPNKFDRLRSHIRRKDHTVKQTTTTFHKMRLSYKDITARQITEKRRNYPRVLAQYQARTRRGKHRDYGTIVNILQYERKQQRPDARSKDKIKNCLSETIQASQYSS